MLVLTRKPGETITIGEGAGRHLLTVNAVQGGTASMTLSDDDSKCHLGEMARDNYFTFGYGTHEVLIKVIEVYSGHVALGFEADKSIAILRDNAKKGPKDATPATV